MSRQCCKGCWTQQCEGCRRYICPTSGHREYSDEVSGFYCHSCGHEKAMKDRIKQLEEERKAGYDSEEDSDADRQRQIDRDREIMVAVYQPSINTGKLNDEFEDNKQYNKQEIMEKITKFLDINNFIIC